MTAKPQLSFAEFQKFAHLGGTNFAYIDALYEQYVEDAQALDKSWRDFFNSLPPVKGAVASPVSHAKIREHFLQLAQNGNIAAAVSDQATQSNFEKNTAVNKLIRAYRVFGHIFADIDPLNLAEKTRPEELKPANYGLTEQDLKQNFGAENVYFPQKQSSLRQLINNLEQTYCSSIGSEFMYIDNTEQCKWLQQRLESITGRKKLSPQQKERIIERLTAAEGLEKTLATKYPGTKRFGLEGAESLIPLLDGLLQRAGSYEIKEAVLGMAHRGRLNVLVNIFGKNPKDLFDEFEGKKASKRTGDVKYHLGFSSNVMTDKGEMHIALSFNPSHLEVVSPVVLGSVRSRQDRRADKNGDCVLPIIIHGDAAIAGQGVVMETLQMSKLKGFSVGGTIHVVINNQIGFTTSGIGTARSTRYCTDVVKMLEIPIFHVNADDPEAVMLAVDLAIDYRMKFNKDAVIDLVCYRRHGHNEADEPSGTHPVMYRKIKKHPTSREIYAHKINEEGLLNLEQSKAMLVKYRKGLEAGKHSTQSLVTSPDKSLFVDWSKYLNHQWSDECGSGVTLKKLNATAAKLDKLNSSISLEPRVARVMQERQKMSRGELNFDWGYAEILAFACLLQEGFAVRLVGQDSGRGTFSHRHVAVKNFDSGEEFVPLQHLSARQSRFDIYDSFLSEQGVLGFEYGYATANPKTLVIWEAQFGDFANGAQVIIDQFLSSGEEKWERLCGLTLLLPHGYEGQGAEHSSARLERFLQLSAEENMQVCTPTSAAQIFHLLLRQIIRPIRKPLIVMSPKSLLRNKQASSTFADLTASGFQTVINNNNPEGKSAQRIILCCGKVYYDLLNYREQNNIKNVAIIRLEQLYPFPQKKLEQELTKFANVKHLLWCQEEPRNQGAWYILQDKIRAVVKSVGWKSDLQFSGRPAAAAPAVGSLKLHKQQQELLVKQAFTV